MVDLFDAVPMFKAQDLRHYSCFPFNDSKERREDVPLMEDDEMQDMALMVDDEIHRLETLRFAYYQSVIR